MAERINPVAKSDNTESLLVGEYDESESHESFQKALAEWRGEKETPSVLQPGSTQTTFDLPSVDLKQVEKRVEKLLENSSLSYMDKILLSNLKNSKDEIKMQDLHVDCIMDESPPAAMECYDETFESDCIPSSLEEIITIQELDPDASFVADEVLDAQKIIIQDP